MSFRESLLWKHELERHHRIDTREIQSVASTLRVYYYARWERNIIVVLLLSSIQMYNIPLFHYSENNKDRYDVKLSVKQVVIFSFCKRRLE